MAESNTRSELGLGVSYVNTRTLVSPTTTVYTDTCTLLMSRVMPLTSHVWPVGLFFPGQVTKADFFFFLETGDPVFVCVQ